MFVESRSTESIVSPETAPGIVASVTPAAQALASQGLTRGTVNRVASSLESNQRELLAKAENFSERGKEFGGTGSVLARLELLNKHYGAHRT